MTERNPNQIRYSIVCSPEFDHLVLKILAELPHLKMKSAVIDYAVKQLWEHICKLKIQKSLR